MSFLDRLLGKGPPAGGVAPAVPASRQLPSSLVAKEFGEVNVLTAGDHIDVTFTIMMTPQGQEAEGWQTGVALDASASMRGWYGRMLESHIPPDVIKEYERRGWAISRTDEGKRVKSLKKEAYDDAIRRGYAKATPNVVEPVARNFVSYLADNLDADGGTTVIYWACDDGAAFEVIGDFTGDQCKTLAIEGPASASFGAGTHLEPAVRYFVERFADAKRGMYIFITDGKLDDLAQVIKYTKFLAHQIASGKRNSVKCVLIGVGEEIDESQMAELDDLDTGTEVDIWDHKIAKEMRDIIEIFAEVVSESHIVAPMGAIYDSKASLVRTFADGVPARITVSLPNDAEWFELEVGGRRIRQSVVVPT